MLRLTTIAIGIACLLWLSLEDTDTLPVALLGTSLSVVLIASWWQRLPDSDRSGRQGVLVLVLTGSLAGSSSVVATTLLMFFKTAWHGHLYPDYPILMLVAMLERLPVWALAGAFLGLAIAVGRYRTPGGNTNPLSSDSSGSTSTIADRLTGP